MCNIFQNCDDENQREISVTRYINEPTKDVSLDGIGGQPVMDIRTFHMLWYGNVPASSSQVKT